MELNQIQQKIIHAANLAQRNAASINLIAVSKTRSIENIRQLYDQGIRDFGENRAQELADKAQALAKDCPDINWHFIGRLQSRQVKIIAPYVSYVHSIDRLSIAETLSKHMAARGQTLPVFIQVNVSGEVSKAGFDFYSRGHRHFEEQHDAASSQQAWIPASVRMTVSGHRGLPLQHIDVLSKIRNLPGINPIGLMTMAPEHDTDTEIEAVFERTARFKDQLNHIISGLNLTELSMGMSNDFELAIRAGATYVRIGRALFT